MSGRLTLSAVIGLAAFAGLFAPHEPIQVDAELGLVLRFMAIAKGSMALGAAALVAWRLGSPVRRLTAGAAIGSVALMAAAAGLIWSLAYVAIGAVLFHVGLLALLVLAWRDGRARVPRWVARARTTPQRLLTVTATSFLRRNGSVQGGS